MNRYHTVIIGAGPAGHTSALKLAKAGKAVCLIDKSEVDLGGTCLNLGCIPTKSFLESANLYQKIKLAENFGIKAETKKPDLKKIKEKAANDIHVLKKGFLSLLKNANLSLELGEASFLSVNKISLKSASINKEIEADNFILATGSVPKELPLLKIDNRRIFDSSGLCKKLPQGKNIFIIGGGYIGCEFAQFYNAMDFEVTVADVADSLLAGQDRDIIKILERQFLKKGIKVLTSHKIEPADIEKFDLVLSAVGRKPNIEKLKLNRAGVAIKDGFVEVDSRLRTSQKNIYAIGDVINAPMLAHAAFIEGGKAADSVLGRKIKPVNYSLVPEVIFTDPQIASIGLKEAEADGQGIEVEVRKNFFKANPKALIAREASGFVKLVFSKKEKKLLGGSIIGPEATELIHVLISFVKKGATKLEIEESIYAHPTLAEIFGRRSDSF